MIGCVWYVCCFNRLLRLVRVMISCEFVGFCVVLHCCFLEVGLLEYIYCLVIVS